MALEKVLIFTMLLLICLKPFWLGNDPIILVSVLMHFQLCLFFDWYLQKVSQFMSRAARLNEAFSVVRRVPIIRPALPAGGVNPWPVMSLRWKAFIVILWLDGGGWRRAVFPNRVKSLRLHVLTALLCVKTKGFPAFSFAYELSRC